MNEYLDLNLIVHKEEGFSEDEAGDVLLELCVFLDNKFKTTSTGTVKILHEEDL